ncbi:unnamed protein product [Prorocentrum cordatum]|nr:unnamed protein product [Polarella glacialis]
MRMVHATAAWSQDLGGDEDVTCRVGVHTGPCVGGIVGNDMQRYHLFGPLTTCLEVLESTSHPGRVHVSRACKEAVESWQRGHESRGDAPTLHFEVRTGEGLLGAKGDVYPFSAAGVARSDPIGPVERALSAATGTPPAVRSSGGAQ